MTPSPINRAAVPQEARGLCIDRINTPPHLEREVSESPGGGKADKVTRSEKSRTARHPGSRTFLLSLTLLRRLARLSARRMERSRIESATTSGSNLNHTVQPCVTDSTNSSHAFSCTSSDIDC